MNLYEWIKAGGFRGVHSGVIKRFTVQIVECMVILHENRIVHCDLKPEVGLCVCFFAVLCVEWLFLLFFFSVC